MSQSGRIDVLINNAGYGLTGAFDVLTIDEIKQKYETNFFEVVRETQAVLPVMRKQKSGIIVATNIENERILVGFAYNLHFVGVPALVPIMMKKKVKCFKLIFLHRLPRSSF
jgi:hypothetical protein